MLSLVYRSRSVALLSFALLGACASTIESMRITPLPLDPKPFAHPVRLYFTAKPRCPYEEIAVVRVDEVLMSDYTADQLRSRVRRLGGDAVVGITEVVEDHGLVRTETVSRSRDGDSTSSKSSTEYRTAVRPDLWRYLEGKVVHFTQTDCRE